MMKLYDAIKYVEEYTRVQYLHQGLVERLDDCIMLKELGVDLRLLLHFFHNKDPRNFCRLSLKQF